MVKLREKGKGKAVVSARADTPTDNEEESDGEYAPDGTVRYFVPVHLDLH